MSGDLRLLVDKLVRERVAEELKTVAKKVKTAPVAKFTAKEKADAKKQKDWVKKVEEIIGGVITTGSAIKLKEEQKKGAVAASKRKLQNKAQRTEFVGFSVCKWTDYYSFVHGDGGDPVPLGFEWELEKMDITSRDYDHAVALDFFDSSFKDFTKKNGKDSIDLESCSQRNSQEMEDF